MPKYFYPDVMARLTPEERIFVTADGYSNPEFVDIDDLLCSFYNRDGKSPEEFLLHLIKNKEPWMFSAIHQGKKLLERPDFPWHYIKKQINYSKLQESESAVREWFENILKIMGDHMKDAP